MKEDKQVVFPTALLPKKGHFRNAAKHVKRAFTICRHLPKGQVIHFAKLPRIYIFLVFFFHWFCRILLLYIFIEQKYRNETWFISFCCSPINLLFFSYPLPCIWLKRNYFLVAQLLNRWQGKQYWYECFIITRGPWATMLTRVQQTIMA